MTIPNIVLILALLGFVGAGVKDGFVHTLGRLVGAVLGFLLARAWSITLGSFLAVVLPTGWARLVAFILIFVLVSRVVGFIFKLAEGIFRLISFIPFLKSINSLLGAVTGGVEGVVVLGGIVWIITNFDLIPSLIKLSHESFMAQALLKGFNTLLSFAV